MSKRLQMVHDALILACGHVIEGDEWTRGSQVRGYCSEHGLKDVVARSAVSDSTT